MLLLLAYLVTALSALLVYLGAPNQAFLAKPISKAAGTGLGVATLVAGLALFIVSTSGLVGVFLTFVVFMSMWSLLPFLGVVRWRTKGEAK